MSSRPYKHKRPEEWRDFFVLQGGLLFRRDGKTFAESVNVSGHIQIWDGSRQVSKHRVVYYLHHGQLPRRIDHLDRDPRNNSVENLREISSAFNRMNSDVSHGSVPLQGVSKCGDKYRARIRKDGKSRCLGLYMTAEAAHSAYRSAREELFPGAYVSASN